MWDDDLYRLEQGGGSLLETLNHALDLGVVVHGDVTVSLANVPLIYLGLNVLLSSTETIRQARGQHPILPEDCRTPPASPPAPRAPEPATALPATIAPPEPDLSPPEASRSSAPRAINIESSSVERGLVKLVLTLTELIRRLLEHQAIRRMDGGSLSPQQIEELGLALMRLEEKMAELKTHFGVDEEELNLD